MKNRYLLRLPTLWRKLKSFSYLIFALYCNIIWIDLFRWVCNMKFGKIIFFNLLSLFAFTCLLDFICLIFLLCKYNFLIEDPFFIRPFNPKANELTYRKPSIPSIPSPERVPWLFSDVRLPPVVVWTMMKHWLQKFLN